MKMMMIMVIILMLDDDNAQKSSTAMTLWSKYTPFKYYHLVKKGPNQPGRGLFSVDAFPNGTVLKLAKCLTDFADCVCILSKGNNLNSIDILIKKNVQKS